MPEERNVDDWLTGFMEWSKNSESPEMYRLWVGISAIAAAMQRKCVVQWGALNFYPNMYVILVGPSGCRKGTAMAFGYRLLADLQIKMAAQATTRQALIRRLKSVNAVILDPVTGQQRQHSSLTIFSEEFTVFLGYQQYELMADLCDWFDCKEQWTYETKNMGVDEVTGVWVNLIGATTPSLVRRALPVESVAGGLTSRMIFVYEEKKGKTVILPSADPILGEKLRNDLERIYLMNGRFKVTDAFFKKWADWYTYQSAHPPFQDDAFDGYIDRRPTHIMKMSMILNASRTNSMIIDVEDLDRAIQLLERTERKMTMTLRGHGTSDISDLMHRVLSYLTEVKRTTLPELLRRFYKDADRRTMDRVIETLISMKWIQLKHSGTTPGEIEYTGPTGEDIH